MEYENLRIEQTGPVSIFTLARPERLNAIDTRLNWELHAAFDVFAAAPDQWVAIITGAGDRAFSAGHDLKAEAEGAIGELPPTGFGGITARHDLDKPVIAAVNGIAMGGGFEIALACDIILAADNAVFALPEPRVGLAALAGGLQRLPRSIGYHRAMAAILTSRRMSAEEGLALGFVHTVHSPQDLMREAMAVARTICEASPLSVRASKAAVRRGFDTPLAQQLDEQSEQPQMAAMMRSQDATEGPRAFAEKRAPIWKGC